MLRADGWEGRRAKTVIVRPSLESAPEAPARCARRRGSWLYGENHSKARLAGHHLRVGLGGLLERHRLDHGGNSSQNAEFQRRVSGRRSARESRMWAAHAALQGVRRMPPETTSF